MQSTMNDRPNPDAIRVLFARSLQLYREGALERAASGLSELLQLDPVHFDALHLQGLIAAQSGRAERAVELIQEAIRQNPTVPAAHRHLGHALRDAGRLEEARSSYGRAIELRGEFKEAYLSRALVSSKCIALPSCDAALDATAWFLPGGAAASAA